MFSYDPCLGDGEGQIERLVHAIMGCVTGKTSFHTEELALEAMVQNHIRNQHRPGAGPQDIYQCPECGNWHFTSRPPTNPFLLKPETIARIKEEGRAMDWEHKFK